MKFKKITLFLAAAFLIGTAGCLPDNLDEYKINDAGEGRYVITFDLSFDSPEQETYYLGAIEESDNNLIAACLNEELECIEGNKNAAKFVDKLPQCQCRSEWKVCNTDANGEKTTTTCDLTEWIKQDKEFVLVMKSHIENDTVPERALDRSPKLSATILGYETFKDIDLDNVADAIDNCIEVSNEDQTDSDEDSLGDLCDACPTVFDPTNESDECLNPEAPAGTNNNAGNPGTDSGNPNISTPGSGFGSGCSIATTASSSSMAGYILLLIGFRLVTTMRRKKR